MGQQQPAGWYVDPADVHRYRWWGGDAWTTHTQDRTEIDIAAAEAAMRPLPDFDAVEDSGPSDRDKRRVPVLLALAALFAIVATAGFVSFGGRDRGGHDLHGEIRVPTAHVAGWTARANRFLGDGDPCGEGGPPGVGSGTQVVVSSARGDELGTASLGSGQVERTLTSTSCVFPYTVEGVGDAQVYVVHVGPRIARRAAKDVIESADWTFDLQLG